MSYCRGIRSDVHSETTRSVTKLLTGERSTAAQTSTAYSIAYEHGRKQGKLTCAVTQNLAQLAKAKSSQTQRGQTLLSSSALCLLHNPPQVIVCCPHMHASLEQNHKCRVSVQTGLPCSGPRHLPHHQNCYHFSPSQFTPLWVTPNTLLQNLSVLRVYVCVVPANVRISSLPNRAHSQR